MVTASSLTKVYGPRVAVARLSFSLHRSEVVALLGPNGAGKTTTLRLLVGLIAPTSGTVSVDGMVPGRATWPTVRRRFGFLTESPGLWDRLSVEANLLTHARLHGLTDPGHRVAALIERFDLSDRSRDPAGALSKGMRQKVALARALLHDPDCLLLDEPTAGLDPEVTHSVRDLIGELRAEGRAVLLSTHNLDEAERVADRVAIVQQTLVAFDTPAELRRRLGVVRVRVSVEGPAARFREVATEAGGKGVEVDGEHLRCQLPDATRDTPTLVERLVHAGARIRTVVPEDANLEAVYLALVHRSGESAPEERS